MASNGFYQTGQFARRASVTLRTLRYYDKVGLLSPRQHTESGYRLYAEEDLLTLQQILALKFLGFSLDEIKLFLQTEPGRLEEVLAQQRAMMEDKRNQLDSIVKAIRETETLLQAGVCDWDSLVRVIGMIQMEQKTHWAQKYFNEEQLQKMDELIQTSYSEEAKQKFASGRPWTEEDQKRVEEQWRYVATESERLAAAGADPAGEEAQALAKSKSDLLSAFTQGDPDVEAGLGKFWESFQAMPKEEMPFDASPYLPGAPGADLLDKAMAIYQERRKAAG